MFTRGRRQKPLAALRFCGKRENCAWSRPPSLAAARQFTLSAPAFFLILRNRYAGFRRRCEDASAPVLNVSLVLVIVNLGMPLDYRLIAGAGLFTAVYILSRALGKIGGAYLGGKWTKAPDTVMRYLGFTLLPHSGVSLVFTGIAATTLSSIDPSLAAIVQGTIVAAAIINEVIAVVIAKYASQWAGEIQTR